MMKFKSYIIIFVAAFALMGLKAQEKWTLQECIDYTLENNLSLRMQELDVKDKGFLEKNARNQALPNLSANLSVSESFNQSISPDNTYVNNNSINSSFGVSTGLTLFNGFAIRNAVNQAKRDREAAEYNLESRKNDVLLLLLQGYLDILLKQEIVAVAKDQLSSTQKEKEAVQIKYEVGEVSKDIYLENQAQEAREVAALNQAKNNLAYAKLLLAHILDLENPESFDVVTMQLPDIMAKVSLYNTAALFDEARMVWPAIKAQEKTLEGSGYVIDQAKAGYYPTVSAFAGYSGGYVYTIGIDGNPTFQDQMRLRSNPYFGLRVNIPLFSRFMNKNNVNRAQLNYDAMSLQLKQVENQLRETIKEAYVSAVAAQSQYESAQKTLDATRESFRFAEEKYDLDALSPYDYNIAKSQLMQAESELLQAKYQFIFSAKVLDFYKNNTITL